jgi:hypothetical protein
MGVFRQPQHMQVSATYICPIRGLANLEPPDAVRLHQAAGAAKDLGVERVLLPVLEESLIQSARFTVGFLDGLIHALNGIDEAGLKAWLIAPAQKVLGLNWVPPYMVRAVRDPAANQVFVDGKVRRLLPIDWWADPAVIQTRIRALAEMINAVRGHPALTGWLLLDRALEWARPEPQAADLVYRSFAADVRQEDEETCICLGFGWAEFLEPHLAKGLVNLAERVRISGLETWPAILGQPDGPADELLLASYLGTLGNWLFGHPTEVEIGWGLLDRKSSLDELIRIDDKRMVQGLSVSNWLSLADPEPRIALNPPWSLRSGLASAGLLGCDLAAKEGEGPWLREVLSLEPSEAGNDFIDVSREEYLADPATHFRRLWDHFR